MLVCYYFIDGVSNGIQDYSRDMGQMVHNYKRVVNGLGYVTIKGLV